MCGFVEPYRVVHYIYPLKTLKLPLQWNLYATKAIFYAQVSSPG